MRALLALLLLSGCHDGEDEAIILDPAARCVRLNDRDDNGSSYYCLIRGISMFCDKNGCLPVIAATPEMQGSGR